jgi:hypothetical protein
MPRTEQLVVALLKRLTKEIAVPGDPLSIDQAIQQVRQRILSIPYNSTRVAVTVWLLQRLTIKEPQFTTVINTLNHDDLKEGKLSQAQANSLIEALLKGTSRRHYGILTKVSRGDRLTISSIVIKQISK